MKRDARLHFAGFLSFYMCLTILCVALIKREADKPSSEPKGRFADWGLIERSANGRRGTGLNENFRRKLTGERLTVKKRQSREAAAFLLKTGIPGGGGVAFHCQASIIVQGRRRAEDPEHHSGQKCWACEGYLCPE